jgi:small ligand-binding sensory domain FIST
MNFASAIVTERQLAHIEIDRALQADEVSRLLIEGVEPQLNSQTVDLAALFISSHFANEAATIAANLRATLKPRVLIGCTAEGVISCVEEIENEPAVSLVAARMPNVTLTPFLLNARHMSEWATFLSDGQLFHHAIGTPENPKCFILLADPFSVPIEGTGEEAVGVLRSFNAFHPGVAVVGGVASGAPYPGANAMILNDVLSNHGAVGVALSGAVEVDVIVSQGCRPVGKPFVVTDARHNYILGLDGARPLTTLHQLIESLDVKDRALLQGGLFIGRAIRPSRDTAHDILGRGDFLIRGVVGADQRTGGIAIGDVPVVGELVQFHVRDANTAEEDFDLMLAPQGLFDSPSGALLFSCNGRGTRLFDHPNGDISIVQRALGDEKPVELAGFFCGGEIGPIGGKNFLHGHTASLALFRPK